MGARISVGFIDGEGETFRVPFHFGDDLDTIAKAQAFADDFLPALKAVIDGGIVSCEVAFALDLPGGVSTPAVSNTRVDAGATFSARNTAGRRSSWYIPTFKPSLIVNRIVNLTDSAVSDLVDLFVTGDGTVAPTDINKLDLTAVPKAFQSTRKTN